MKIGKGKNKRYVYNPYKGFAKQNVTLENSSHQEIISKVLSGEIILCCGRMQDESGYGGDILIEKKISEIGDEQTNLKFAYEMVTQRNIINLGIRRQHEQGKGLLNFMDKKYRRLVGLYDATDADDIIFNWYTIPELENAQRDSALFVNTNSLKPIALILAKNCDAAHEFPCLFSGVPLNEEATMRGHLLFMVKSNNVSDLKINIKTQEKFI
jgi:hypothetical protein